MSDTGILSAVAEQPSSEAELVALYEELRHSGGVVLERLARRGAFGRELEQLCHAMRANLETDWYDDSDLIESAIATIEFTGAADVVGQNVVVHLPERAESDECQLIAAIRVLLRPRHPYRNHRRRRRGHAELARRGGASGCGTGSAAPAARFR